MKLLQEELMEQDPSGWRMLVGCVLLNLTTRTQVDRVVDRLFTEFPDAHAMMNAEPHIIEGIIAPLGLQILKTSRLKEMSRDWVGLKNEKERSDAMAKMQLTGVGSYARDSWWIFVEGRRDVDPIDKELKKYLEAQK